jgi:hypothetical protein
MPSSPRKKTTKKSSTKKTKPQGPPTCEICNRPLPYAGERFCPLHALLDLGGQYAEEQQKLGTVMGHVAAMALRAGSSFLNNAYEQEMHKKAVFAARMYHAQRKMRAEQARKQAAQQQAPQRPDPFAVLGLDRGCSESDVRARQRELARIFHTDVGGGAAANDRMAEINAAADEAVRILKG